MQEAFLIMYYSKGGFTHKELSELKFDLYEIAVKEALRIQTLENKKQGPEINNGR